MTYPPQQPEGWSDPAYPAYPPGTPSDPAYPAYPPATHPASGIPGQPPVSGPAAPGYPLIPDPANPYPQPGAYPQPGVYQQPGAYPQPVAYPTDKDGGYPYAAGYPAQPGYGYGWPEQRKTSGMAIASLVISIIGAFSLACYGAGAVPAAIGAILGHVARRQIRTSGEDGDGMALAGIITGWIVTGLGLLVVGFLVFLFITIWATAPDTSDPGTGGPYY